MFVYLKSLKLQYATFWPSIVSQIAVGMQQKVTDQSGNYIQYLLKVMKCRFCTAKWWKKSS